MATKSNKSEVSLEVAVNTPTAEVLAALDAKIKSLKRIEETPYKTQGNLTGVCNVKTETKIDNLIRAYASVIAREKVYVEAAEELGHTTYNVFTVDGGTREDWKHDIKLRTDIINYDETLTKLKVYKDKMSSFLSQQEQKEMLLKEMQSFLGSTEV